MAQAQQPDELWIQVRRAVAAVPSVVYQAFTDPHELAHWWGPAGFTVRSLEVDPRVGGRYRIEMQPPEGEAFYLTGEFVEVEPPVRLTYTFAWEDPDPDDVENHVRLAFADLGGATEIALTHGPFKTEARLSLHEHGWDETFDKLDRFLSQASVTSRRGLRQMDVLSGDACLAFGQRTASAVAWRSRLAVVTDVARRDLLRARPRRFRTRRRRPARDHAAEAS